MISIIGSSCFALRDEEKEECYRLRMKGMDPIKFKLKIASQEREMKHKKSVLMGLNTEKGMGKKEEEDISKTYRGLGSSFF